MYNIFTPYSPETPYGPYKVHPLPRPRSSCAMPFPIPTRSEPRVKRPGSSCRIDSLQRCVWYCLILVWYCQTCVRQSVESWSTGGTFHSLTSVVCSLLNCLVSVFTQFSCQCASFCLCPTFTSDDMKATYSRLFSIIVQLNSNRYNLALRRLPPRWPQSSAGPTRTVWLARGRGKEAGRHHREMIPAGGGQVHW